MTRFGDRTASGSGWPDSVLDYVFAGNKRTLPIFFYIGWNPLLDACSSLSRLTEV